MKVVHVIYGSLDIAAAPEPTQPPAPSVTALSAPGAVVISSVFYDGQSGSTESDEYAEITNLGGRR